MKYAVISDIHGNLPCLEAALADAGAHGAEQYLFVGDYCIGSPWGEAVADVLRRCPNARIVCGNEEAHFHPGVADAIAVDNGQYEVTRWTYKQMSPANLAFLNALPEHLIWQEEGLTLHMAHRHMDVMPEGAMHRYLSTTPTAARYPEGSVTHEQYLADVRALLEADEALHAALPGMEDILIFGHTHGQWHAEIDGHLLLNPGSCGEPLDCCGFAACYTLLTIENGRYTVEERRIPMDLDAMIARVKASPQYGAARIWSELLFTAWRTSRESIAKFLRFADAYATQIGDPVRPLTKDTWNRAYTAWKA